MPGKIGLSKKELLNYNDLSKLSGIKKTSIIYLSIYLIIMAISHIIINKIL